MNRLKKVIFALAVVIGLGASDALAQCVAGTTVTSTSPQVRLEATVELIGTVTVTCTAAATATQASIVIQLSPSSTVFVATATTPDNKSTFPNPTLVPAAGTISGLQIIGGGTSTLTFLFIPDGATTTSYTIGSLRANINASGLAPGTPLQATVTTGGSISAPQNTLNVAVVNRGLSTSGTGPTGFGSVPTGGLLGAASNTLGTTGVAGFPLLVAQCAPGIATPSGSGSVTANPDSGGTPNSLGVNLKEGYTNAWTAAELDAFGGGVGTRFRIQLTGIPTGMTVFAPREFIGGTSGLTTGAGSATLTIRRVDTTVAADGSGGAVLATAGGSQFDRLTPSSGVVTIIYEVIASSATASESVTLLIALTGSTSLGTGSVSGSVGFAAVGQPTPTTNAARPQFVAGSSTTVANVVICASYLLFPWIAYTGDGAYDTGFAISNTTADPTSIGTKAQTGDVTLYFWRSDGTNNPAPVTIATGLAAGRTTTYVLSQLGSAFTGYAIAVCNFQLGHGFAFINNPQPGTGGAFAQGYLALSVTNPRLGAPVSANESAGH